MSEIEVTVVVSGGVVADAFVKGGRVRVQVIDFDNNDDATAAARADRSFEELKRTADHVDIEDYPDAEDDDAS